MITAVHALIYTDDPTATRAFLRDVLQWPSVSESGGDDPADWLIFRSGPSEVGVHPTGGPDDEWQTTRHHQIALMCDDLAATIGELASRGATFTGETRDEGWGITVHVEVPGADPIMLYQARHKVAYDL